MEWLGLVEVWDAGGRGAGGGPISPEGESQAWAEAETLQTVPSRRGTKAEVINEAGVVVAVVACRRGP